MPKQNSILNYFSSPRNVNSPSGNSKTPSKKEDKKSETPKRDLKGDNKKTPKSNKKKDEKKSRGKENLERTVEKKRSIDDSIDDDAEDNLSTPVKSKDSLAPKPKRRRIIVPTDSDDSGDEYKPGSEDESMEVDESEGEDVSENESLSEKSSEDETPKKKSKTPSKTPVSKVKNTSRANKSKTISIKPEKTGSQKSKSSVSSAKSEGSTNDSSADGNLDSWPHLKYEFLQPKNIKDICGRKPSDPNYDPKTVQVPKSFLDGLTPASRQWWVLKSKNFDSILFFKVGKFYELYHMDAVIGVQELGLTFMRGEFAHSGFPEVAYGRMAGSLVEKGYKVARIEQTETPDMMKERCDKMNKPTKFDKVVNREICQVSTKGTRIYTAQDVDATSSSSCYLLSIVEKPNPGKGVSSYGVCFVDTSIGVFNLCQFDDDQCTSRLLTMLAHYPPAHILYERNNLTPKTLQILTKMFPSARREALKKETEFYTATKVLGILHEEEYFKNEKTSEFTWPSGLQPYLNPGDSLGLTAAEDKELAVTALGGCVYVLKKFLVDQQLLSQGRFETYQLPDDVSRNKETKFAHNMILDAVTIHNLRIFGDDCSLYSTLDNCCTPFGKRQLKEWMCRPSCRKSVIEERQQAVLELLENPDVAAEAQKLLKKVPDLERLLAKIHANGTASKFKNHPDNRAIFFDNDVYSKRKINDFIKALSGYEQLVEITELFKDFENNFIIKCTRVEPEGDFPDIKDLLNHFKTAFDHEEAKKEGNIIPKKGVDEDYDAIQKEQKDLEKEINSYLEQQRRHFGTAVKYIGTGKNRFQIEVSEAQTRKAGDGYELTSSRKGFKRYWTEETKDFVARSIDLESRRETILKNINSRIFARFSEHYELWSNATYNIAILDCLIAFAEYARTHDTCVPTLYDDLDDEQIKLEIVEGRHPSIPVDNFIPNDTYMGTNGKARVIILTGPNMGGKSTLMRQVGVITVMAQMGCHVPASECRLTLVDRIFTRLGAYDDIITGRSTFFVELNETAIILRNATKYSLALVDELGRGTSTHDGTAIAGAVIEGFLNINCRTIFSTHYHSLVQDFKNEQIVTLAHMACMEETEKDEDVTYDTVTFLYKLSDGPCPKSYGFNAARLAGLPSHIINRAHEVAMKLERETHVRRTFVNLCKSNDPWSLKPLIEAL